MRSIPRPTLGIKTFLVTALVLVVCAALTACGGSSAVASTSPTATTASCTVPADGKTAYTSADGTYRVTVPAAWAASCFSAAPFSGGVRAVAPDGQYAVYILPARSSKIPAGSNGLQLFIQDIGPAFLDAQTKPDSVTPCCADVITFGGTQGIDVQYDVITSGVTSEAEFLAVAHDNAPFVILGLFPSVANEAENAQLHTMVFSSFAFLY